MHQLCFRLKLVTPISQKASGTGMGGLQQHSILLCFPRSNGKPDSVNTRTLAFDRASKAGNAQNKAVWSVGSPGMEIPILDLGSNYGICWRRTIFPRGSRSHLILDENEAEWNIGGIGFRAMIYSKRMSRVLMPASVHDVKNHCKQFKSIKCGKTSQNQQTLWLRDFELTLRTVFLLKWQSWDCRKEDVFH